MAETANDRFKRRFSAYLWGCVAAGTLLHAGLFVLSPQFRISAFSAATGELKIVEVVPEIPIPEPPAPITRPPTPKFVLEMNSDPYLPPNMFFEERPVVVPPPPATGSADLSDAVRWTPMDVAPRVRDERALARSLLEHYPPMLRDAGIGGVVRLWFFIDEKGKVVRALVKDTSGLEALDEAALAVASTIDFVPAYRMDQPVSVWVALELRFQSS